MSYPQAGRPDDPRAMTRLVLLFLESLKVRNYSRDTLLGRRQQLSRFLAWCAERSIERPTEVTLPILERYQRYLFQLRMKNGHPYTPQVQSQYLTAVRVFFKWLRRQRHVLSNPAADLESARLPRRLPLDSFSQDEAERVLCEPDVTTPLGLRDRAILEVFYSTGIRRTELVNLDVADVHFDRGVLFIREGKGGKDRVVPIGERALAWVNKYLTDVRPQYVFGQDPQALFLNYEGKRLDRQYVSHEVKGYMSRASISRRGACHLFRHTMATLMLENGADIRHIQSILGHANLVSTQLYTQVSIAQLKAVHRATHPAERSREQRDSNAALSDTDPL